MSPKRKTYLLLIGNTILIDNQCNVFEATQFLLEKGITGNFTVKK